MRAGTYAKIYNTLVKGKPNCLTTETAETETSLVNGNSILSNVWIASAFSGKEGIYTAEMIAKDDVNKENQEITLTDGYIGTIEGGDDMPAVDGFFVAAPYKGAISNDNNWTAGWTK